MRDASVSAMRMQYTGGKRRLVQSGRNSMTNDLGQFRLFGLPPGEYYVSATLRTMDTMIMDMMGGSNIGGPTGSNRSSRASTSRCSRSAWRASPATRSAPTASR